MQQLPTILPPPPLPDGTEPTRSPERTANLMRFQSELEFVQCLANPLYLHELHVQRYFDDPAFLNYLEYLDYWRKPEYVRFIIYPTCLAYLQLLGTPTFRTMLGDMGFVGELMRIGTTHFETWRAEKVDKVKAEPVNSPEAGAADEKPDIQVDA
ncbi:suppressor of hpr1 [Vanrija albida]|uniref:Mediator of RNA polymerase II transcription subunit 31 n=1 Tax=Vanrija albida TaxID=181172 RepID=A0ABR3QG44_9TREE